ncbi:MAG TPA: DUF4349 domain-containing protein [Acidimicrobiales bacterium]|nr:DUF4349 domain-containing protein [Acidimicrobiales bacterium]
MPALTDDFLGALFVEAGAAFEVPASGASDTVDRALGTDNGSSDGSDDGSLDEGAVTPAAETDEPPPGRRTGPGTLRSHRLLAVAAGLIVLAGIAGVGLALRPATGSHPTASVAAGPQRSTSTPKAGGPSRSFSPTQGTTQPQPKQSLSAPPSAAPQSTSPAGQSTKIAQTGSLDLQVPKGTLTSTITALTTLATRAQGFVANTQTRAHPGERGTSPQGSVTLEVPEASFGAVLHDAQVLGKSLNLTTKATDVTGKYVDLQSRITSLQASRQQYLAILAKATSISDILAVQAQLDTLQSQIEQLQGQLAVLTNETTYSTLTVTVHEPPPAHPPTPHAPSGIDRAWHDSVRGFFDGVDGVVGAAGPVLFVVLSLGVVALVGRLLWRRWQRHNL